MYDPHPNDKDGYISAFEEALISSKIEIDDKMKEEIMQQISELPNTVSGDK